METPAKATHINKALMSATSDQGSIISGCIADK